MSDTEARSPSGAAQMLADALLRSVSGTAAQLRVTGPNTDTNMAELGLVATGFVEVTVTPAVMRRLRPGWQSNDTAQWELLVSATSVQAQAGALDLDSAQALFGMTLMVTVAGQGYLIEKVSANEAFGQVYLYRLLLREVRQQSV